MPVIGVASADYQRADRAPDGVEHWGGSGWARLGQYLPLWKEAGYDVVTGILWKEEDGLYVEEANLVKRRPDIVILQRLMHEGINEASKFGRSKGQFVINDVDDWYWGLDPSNDAFLASHPSRNSLENTKFYYQGIAAASLLTVSTPYLLTRLDQRLSNPTMLFPNYIDVERFTPVEHSPVPTIGWAGSTNHRSSDLETLRGVLGPFASKHGVPVHHSGDTDRGRSFAQMVGMDPDEITTSPRTNAEGYPSLLTFDVGIVPLRDTPFNYAKSAIKGMEYAAAGIPFVAQDVPSYRALYEQWGGRGFFLAKRPKDWIKALQRLLDLDTRLAMQADLLDAVKMNHVTLGVQQWIDVFDEAERVLR
jgi:glycosyltransferase involved in cell wall biosynthesis